MPLFEFQCNSCSNIFEELIFSNEVPACPHCHFEKTEKLISRPCRNHGGGNNAAVSNSGAASGCGTCSGGSCSTCGT